MTGIATLTIVSTSSLAFWVLRKATEPDMPWTEVAGGVGVLVAIVLFLRHMAEMKKESHETIRKAHETICVQAAKHVEGQDRFAEAIERCASTFAESALSIQKEANAANAAMLHEAREAHAQCEKTIHDLLRGRRSPDRREPE